MPNVLLLEVTSGLTELVKHFVLRNTALAVAATKSVMMILRPE